MSKHLGAQVGAFYEHDRSGGLHLIGTYAMARGDDCVDELRFGEGLVGQAALEGKALVLDDISDDCFAINSGLGEIRPRHILVWPVVCDDEVKGVVELGSLEPLDRRYREFLSRIAETIGASLDLAHANIREQALLVDAQVQTEELQANEEHLRNTNERLLNSTKDLEASQSELQAQQEELRVANEELEAQRDDSEKKNSDLREIQRTLFIRASELESMSRYKSEFLANMSHELRTPLNSLLVLSQILENNKEGNLTDKQLESIRTIHSGGKDLLVLINDILDLSKVESGVIDLDVENATIESIVGTIRRQFEMIAQDRGIDLSLQIEDGLPAFMRTDPQRLSQILKNLVSNALKFTSRNGSVNMRVGRPSMDVVDTVADLQANDLIAFAVTDTGVGIPEDRQSAIFDAFVQADGTTSRKYGGTGLGLSISAQFAAALGGEIHLASEEGRGSTFTLLLPESAAEDGSADSARAQPVATEEGLKPESITAGVQDEPASVRDDRRELEPGDKSLLIIEDDVGFARVLFDLAHEKGFKCVVAEEGETGLHYADYYKPSAIILDIGLPGIDGWTVMDRLKVNPDTRHIPVHIMSAMDNAADALRLGAVGSLTKPAELGELEASFATIEAILGKPVGRIMIVTNDESVSRHVADAIGNGDVKYLVVADGGGVCDALKSGGLDCVIITSQIDDMSRLELLERMEAEPAARAIPVVLYSQAGDGDDDAASIARFEGKMIVRAVRSPERLLDETVLFLHRIEANLPEKQREMLRMVHDKESILEGKKILLADDDMRNVFALSTALQDMGIEVVAAKNGAEALERLSRHPDVDLVLMDIMMPEMDGYEATRQIRRQERFARLPIIALTAKAMKGDRKTCLESGASDYMSKPVEMDKLTSLLRVWLYQ